MEQDKDAPVDSLLASLEKELGSIVSEDKPKRNLRKKPEAEDALGSSLTKGAIQKTRPKKTADETAKARLNGPRYSNLLARQMPQTISDTEAVPEIHDNIEESIGKLRLELDEGYEFFKSMGEKLEACDIDNVKNRIKDLQLGEGPHEEGSISDEVNRKIQECFKNNRLDQLATEMGEHFRKCPIKFGDIPEVSEFFDTCNELERGLGKIKEKRNEMSDLEKRIFLAAKDSDDRIGEVRKELDQIIEKKP